MLRRQISWRLFLGLTAVATLAAQSASTTPSVETIVVRMAESRAANRASFRPYVVTRDYTLFGKERSKSKSEVTADLTFVPPDSKQFQIRQSTGSGLGVKIVRQMLEGETEVVADYASTDISTDNYDFRMVGEETIDSHRCYVLEILPKRKRKNLIRGNVWVDANTYRLHRLAGEPVKGPSWWLRNVHITFTYSDVEGMWLQTASEYTTDVRIFGRYAITSRDVSYDISTLAGAGFPVPETFPHAGEPGEKRCVAPCAPDASNGIQSGGR
jgi:hypothetical protein